MIHPRFSICLRALHKGLRLVIGLDLYVHLQDPISVDSTLLSPPQVGLVLVVIRQPAPSLYV